MRSDLTRLEEELSVYERDGLILVPRPYSVYPEPTFDSPLQATGLDADALDAVLDDPRTLRGYAHAADAVEQYQMLATLACHLERYANEVPVRFRARAARLRFMVWSLPVRLPDDLGCLLFPIRRHLVGYALSSADVVGLARAAREDWLSCLAASDNDPWLVERRTRHATHFDADHRWLTEQWPGRKRSERLALSSTSHTDDHRDVAGRVVALHWLPVGDIQAAARAFGPDRWELRWLPWLVPTLAVLVLVAFLGWPGPGIARFLAAGSLLLVLVLGTVLPTGVDGLLLLRVPAAVAVGTAAMLALTSRWWVAQHGWWVGGGLAVAAALYLVLESRLHNVTRTATFARGLLVAFVGLAYAFLVSLVGFGLAAPAIAEQGQCLIGWWNEPLWQERALSVPCTEAIGGWPDTEKNGQVATPVGALVTLTGWSFAIGIAVQLLWDDQPVTAPLGRLRRRGGTS